MTLILTRYGSVEMVLVDSSVWIEYFKGSEAARPLHALIDSNSLCVNDLILCELLPSIRHKGEYALEALMLVLTKIPLTIDWNGILSMQTKNLSNGINKVGIPDLLIAQNVIDNNLELFSLDVHFELMSAIHGFKLYSI